MSPEIRKSGRCSVTPLLLILAATPGALSMQLPPSQPSITQSLLPLANATSSLTQFTFTSTPTPQPTYRQNQVITSSIPLFAVCNPDFSECTTKYSTTEVKWCSATTLPSPYFCEDSGSEGCTVTECDQPVTFSSKVGELRATTTGNATTTYYIAPYMEYIYPHSTPHAQIVSARECHRNGENIRICVDKQETWDASRDLFTTCVNSATREGIVGEEDYGYGLELQQHDHHGHDAEFRTIVSPAPLDTKCEESLAENKPFT